MASAVGIRQTGDDNLTADGTFSLVEHPPVDAGGTIVQSFGQHGLDAAFNLQPTDSDVVVNPFQELNLFLGELAQKLSTATAPVSPHAAWVQIRAIGDALFQQARS